MRIAMVATPWYAIPPRAYGGIELVVALLVDGLVSRGHDVALVATGQPGTTAQTHLASYGAPQNSRVGQALPELLHAAFAARMVTELHVDLVHDHSMAGPLTAAGRRIPTVVTVHNDVTGEPGLILRNLGLAVRAVAISAAQQHLAPDLPWVAVVPNALDAAAYPFEERKQDWALFLGRMNPGKAPHVAIDVARAAGRPIVVAGKCVEAEELDYFEAEVRPRLGPDVEWVGEVDAVRKRELLASASCLLFPAAWEEPFGMVLLEAMACGTPVVGLRRGAVPEIVLDGVTGFVRDEIAELPDAVAAVAELDPKACRRHVELHYCPAVMVERYEQVYRTALSS
jgi:glycosyltransferase involved in cell wall biosynthesis